MKREYEQMREALLSLLCVGDKLNWIRYDYLGKKHWIDQYTITGISEDVISFKEWYHGRVYKKEIECYEGQLYIWEARETDYPYRSNKRIKGIISTLKLLGV
jgi:hypothetical protein